jgi:hypothetical protein
LPRLDYQPGAVGGPRVLALGDLNGDRKPDLVATKFASVTAFLNTTKR